MKIVYFVCFAVVASGVTVWCKPSLWEDVRRKAPWLPEANFSIDWHPEPPPVEIDLATPDDPPPFDAQSYETMLLIHEQLKSET